MKSTTKDAKSTQNDFLAEWHDPSAAYRSRLFWAWNGRLSAAELRRQIGDMQAAGMGGFYMHSRIGLDTPYLEKEWFRMVKTCVDEAKKRGMNAELYDEDRWPSGGCGGQVAKDPAFQMRFLCAAYADEDPRIDPARDRVLARFAVKKNHAYRKLTGKDELRSGEREMLFVRRIADPITWFNGSPPADLMDRQATERFLELTHEAYFRHFGAEFGKTITGIFTDEPTFIYVNGVMNSDEPGYAGQPLPWTDRFPEHFRRRHRYGLLDRLPELWFPVAGEKPGQLRRDFFDTAADLLAKNYFKPIGDWCARHGLAFTGHALCEDTLTGQTARSGEVMRLYPYMQEPGIDMLTNHWQHYLTAKQCASAAHQYGRKFVLSETYGGGEWEMSLTAMKAIGDWQYALGVNRRCLHVGWYSIKGERKRDFPPDFGSFAGNRKPLAALEEYFARLGVALTQGEPCRKLLVIHPIEDFWRGYCGEKIKSYADPTTEADKPLIRLVNDLLAAHLDFDLGSEELLAKDGRVRNGLFQMKKAAYTAVLVPEMTHLRESTKKLLAAFRAAGGAVFTLGKAFPEGRKTTRKTLARDLSPLVRAFSVAGPDGKELPHVLGHLRTAGKERIFFACNTGLADVADPLAVPKAEARTLAAPEAVIRIKSPRVKHVYLCDPATGSMTEPPFRYEKDAVVLASSFGKLESRLYLLTDRKLAAAPAEPETRTARRVVPRLTGFRAEEENTLVLDHALLPTGGIAPEKPQYVLSLDSAFREKCGLSPYNWRAVQPYLVPKPPRGQAFELVYPFAVKVIPDREIVLAHEFPADHELFCNGVRLDRAAQAKFPAGDALAYLAIAPEMLKKGRNTITVRGRYDPADGMFEAMYLVGRFGVGADDALTAYPAALAVGDWRKQGFPYYSGNMVYELEFDLPKAASAIRVTLPEAAAFAVAFRLNDAPETRPCWEPFAAVFRDGLRPGKNRLAVRVYATRRNLMGPFYCRAAVPIAMPGNFRRYDAETKETVPYGLTAAPEIKVLR